LVSTGVDPNGLNADQQVMVIWGGIGQLPRFKGEGIAAGQGAGGDDGMHWVGGGLAPASALAARFEGPASGQLSV